MYLTTAPAFRDPSASPHTGRLYYHNKDLERQSSRDSPPSLCHHYMHAESPAVPVKVQSDQKTMRFLEKAVIFLCE